MAVNYKVISYVYDLIEVLYFNRKEHSPRNALVKMLTDKPVKIVDICAGTGSNSLAIAKQRPNAKITALDLSAEMLNAASKKFNESGVTNINTVIADATDTQIADATYDVAILSLVLHESGEDLRRAILREAQRIIKDNGRLFIIEWEQPKHLLQRIKFSINKLFEPKEFKEFMELNLNDYFREQGFRVINKQSCDYSQVLELGKSYEEVGVRSEKTF
jgi:demethylmenaquinone methyltransferase/2-methoxy-6-polyprenyl-1,4-benzoquinol methylase